MKPRVVVSLTTVPSRIYSLKPTLKSIYNQICPPDQVYLCLPQKCRRTNQKYPSVPSKYSKYCSVVNVQKDYGPLTKIVGALYQETDPETIIITIDDDVIYPRTFIRDLLSAHQDFPDSAIGSAGLTRGQFPFIYSLRFNEKKLHLGCMMSQISYGQKTDFLYGYAGVLYLRKFFPLPSESSTSSKKKKETEKEKFKKLETRFLEVVFQDEHLFRNDDIFISAYLNKRKVPRRLISADEVQNHSGQDALSQNMFTFSQSLDQSIRKCSELGWMKDWEEVPSHQTLGGLVLMILFLLIILILTYFISS